MNIGILIIATNKYIKFLNPLVDSINEKFLTNHKKTIFCFTNHMDYDVSDNVIKIHQEHMNWPLPTLKRFEIFYKNRNYYENMDYLFYLDVDMLINDNVYDDFLPIDKDLLAVIHPGYRRDLLQSFERRTQSHAYVDYNHHVYHCGGVQGGKKDAYLKVCEILSNNIIDDMNKGIVAVWHDESHWNSYLVSNPNSYKELDCDYCYPENPPENPNSWNMPNKKIIIALHKNHAEMRG
jgi:histo-blood group ABO system transferase